MDKSGLKELVDKSGLTVRKLELGLNLPAGTLAKALKGTRALPAKHSTRLKQYVEDRANKSPVIENTRPTGKSKAMINMPTGGPLQIDEKKFEEQSAGINAAGLVDFIEKWDAIPSSKEITGKIILADKVEEFCNTNNCTIDDLFNVFSTSKAVKSIITKEIAHTPNVQPTYNAFITGNKPKPGKTHAQLETEARRKANGTLGKTLDQRVEDKKKV